MFDWNEFVFGRVGGHHVAVLAAIDSSLPLFIVSGNQHMVDIATGAVTKLYNNLSII